MLKTITNKLVKNPLEPLGVLSSSYQLYQQLALNGKKTASIIILDCLEDKPCSLLLITLKTFEVHSSLILEFVPRKRFIGREALTHFLEASKASATLTALG